MSKNVVLTDENGEQILPITVSENVFVNTNKTLVEKLEDIESQIYSLGDNYVGWVDFDSTSFGENLTSFSDYQVPKYRKLGKLVQIVGGMKPTVELSPTASDPVRLLTLPIEIRPSNYKSPHAITQGSNMNKCHIYHAQRESAHYIEIDRYGSNNLSKITPGEWIRLDLMYYVD